MKRPSLKELAKTDRQIARFLERAERKAEAKARAVAAVEAASATGKKGYATNHLPETYDLGEDAAEAINRCILP